LSSARAVRSESADICLPGEPMPAMMLGFGRPLAVQPPETWLAPLLSGPPDAVLSGILRSEIGKKNPERTPKKPEKLSPFGAP
jgi:hypothetical protein